MIPNWQVITSWVIKNKKRNNHSNKKSYSRGRRNPEMHYSIMSASKDKHCLIPYSMSWHITGYLKSLYLPLATLKNIIQNFLPLSLVYHFTLFYKITHCLKLKTEIHLNFRITKHKCRYWKFDITQATIEEDNSTYQNGHPSVSV